MKTENKMKIKKYDFGVLIVFLVPLIVAIGLIILLFFVFQFSNDLKEYQKDLIEFKLELISSCKTQCIENNLSFVSVHFDSWRCFCSDEEDKIIQYKLKT